MTSLQPITTKRLALAGVVLVVALVLALTTVPQSAPGANLHARAVVLAGNVTTRLAAGGTLGSVAPAVARSLAGPGVSVAVLDRGGNVLAHSSNLPGLAPSISARAIRAALANADVRLSSREGAGELATALAPIRTKSGAGVLAVTGIDPPAQGLSGARVAVILLCVALLAGLCYLAGLLSSSRRNLQPRSAPQSKASRPRAAAADATASELEELISACVEIIDRAPSSALSERLDEALGRAGVVRVDPAGERFDPDLHHAVQRVATDRVDRHNVVAATLRPGYSGHGRVVREPEVAVYRHEGS